MKLNGRTDDCSASQDIREMREALEEDLLLSREIRNVLAERVNELISVVDRINQTLMRLFTYGLAAIALAWALDHFGIEKLSALLEAAKAVNNK